MKLKLNLNYIGLILSVILLSLYAYSRSSWDSLVPFSIWIGFLFVVFVFEGILVMRGAAKIKKNMLSLCQLCMVLVILVWNNQTYVYEGGFNHKLFLHIILMGFWIISIGAKQWGIFYTKAMFFCGIFYAIWTLVSYLNPNVFYNVIYPIVGKNVLDDYYLIQYELGYMAGLTSHYSTNGMYLAIGVCAAIGNIVKIYSNKENIRSKLCSIILAIIILVGLLLTGKRGPVLYIVICVIVWYYMYNSDKPISRLLKIIVIGILLLCILYLIALVVPGVWNVIKRFEEMSSLGNISSNRFELWREAWDAFIENPIWGKGWYWFKYHNTKGEIYHVHCVYLQWLCELGLIGSIPFWGFTIVAYKHAIYLVRRIKRNQFFSSTDKEIITTAFLFETFFLLFNVTGTGFYEIQVLVPYILGCACIESYYILLKRR